MSERIFAYGSNMCLGRFLEYQVHPEAPGVSAQLQGYSLRFNKRSSDGSGKANVEPRDGDVVWGVLYAIPDRELPVLDEGERGYTRTRMPGIGASGPDPWVYVAIETVDDASLRPYSWYKRFLVEGARSHRLPTDYITMLKAIEAREDPDPARGQRKRSIVCDA
jgi:hypothetical protein